MVLKLHPDLSPHVQEMGIKTKKQNKSYFTDTQKKINRMYVLTHVQLPDVRELRARQTPRTQQEVMDVNVCWSEAPLTYVRKTNTHTLTMYGHRAVFIHLPRV